MPQINSRTDGDVDSTVGGDVEGTVVVGHGVASGTNPGSAFPSGTIAMQMPFFLARGLDLRDCHPGTINVDIAPSTYTILRPQHTFRDIAWTDLHAAETFSFLRCTLSLPDAHAQLDSGSLPGVRAPAPGLYRGWVYYPHPETKPMHSQPTTVLEVLMPFIAGLSYGDRVSLALDPHEIAIHPGSPPSDVPRCSA